jgi:hypothetical protein
MQWCNSVLPRIYIAMNGHMTGYNQRMGSIFHFQGLSYWMLNSFVIPKICCIITILHPRFIFDQIKNEMHFPFRLFELLKNGSWLIRYSTCIQQDMHSSPSYSVLMRINWVSFFKDEYCSRIDHFCRELMSYVFCNLEQVITMIPVLPY